MTLTKQKTEQVEQQQQQEPCMAPQWEYKLAHAAEASEPEIKKMQADMECFNTCAVGEILGTMGMGNTFACSHLPDDVNSFGLDMNTYVQAGDYKDALRTLREFSASHDKETVLKDTLRGTKALLRRMRNRGDDALYAPAIARAKESIACIKSELERL